MRGSSLTELVATVFEAACDPSRIEPFVEDAAGYFGAQSAIFVVWPINNPDVFIAIAHGISTRRVNGMFEDRNDPATLFWQMGRKPPGTTFLSSAQLGGDAASHAMVGLIDATKENRCALILMRNPDHEKFSRSEQEALQNLTGYFSRSLRVNKQFVRLFAQHKTALTLLEYSPRGIAIFGQRGQITFQNAEARRIFAHADIFRIEDDSLKILNEIQHREFYDFLQAARQDNETEIGEHRLTTHIPRAKGRPALQVHVYALPFTLRQAALDDHETLATMLIHDPSNLNALDVELLRAFFGFSSAEANLANALHRGLDLTDAASEIGIRVNTARSQLRSIFKKTGVNSQAALLQEFCFSPRLSI